MVRYYENLRFAALIDYLTFYVKNDAKWDRTDQKIQGQKSVSYPVKL